MKKTIAIILTATLLISVCSLSFSASALQFPKVNDKINELKNSFSNSTSDGLIMVEAYYNTDVMTDDEKDDYVFEKCGIRVDDFEFKRDMTEEEQQLRREKMSIYYQFLGGLNEKLKDQNAAPFFEQMGITLRYNKGNPIYHNRRVYKSDRSIGICLTKEEVLKAAQLDYVDGILCYRRVSKTTDSTILFENTLNWDKIYVYSWDQSGCEINGEYPGELVEKTTIDEFGDEYYVVPVPKYPGGLILSNGEGEKTLEIDADSIVWGGYYAYRLTGTKNEDSEFWLRDGYVVEKINKCESENDFDTPGNGSFVLLNNYGWEEAYIYALDSDGNELYGEFPGKQAKRFFDYGGSQFQITVPKDAVSIVVSNSNGEKTVEIEVNQLYPYCGYSLSYKNDDGDYTLNEFFGYLPQPGEDKDEWLEPDGDLFEEEFKQWSINKYGEKSIADGYNYEELYVHSLNSNPDWALVKAQYFLPAPEPVTFVQIGGIGGRTVMGTAIDSPFIVGYGIYDVKEKTFYGLEELADNCSDYYVNPDEKIDYTKYEGLINTLANMNIGFMTGDVNADKTVDVLDAIEIQKFGAEKAAFNTVQKKAADYNFDGKVDVLDAALIQRTVAEVAE